MHKELKIVRSAKGLRGFLCQLSSYCVLVEHLQGAHNPEAMGDMRDVNYDERRKLYRWQQRDPLFFVCGSRDNAVPH